MASQKKSGSAAGTVTPPVVSRTRESSISADLLKSMADQISEEVWVTPLDDKGNQVVYSDKSDKDPNFRARRLTGNAIAQHKRPLAAILIQEGRIETPYQIKSKAWAVDEDGAEFVFALRLRTADEMKSGDENGDNDTEVPEENPEA